MCPRYLFSNERLPVPDDPAGVQFILQDAVHPLPAAADSRLVPRAAERPGNPFLVQCDGNVARRSGGEVIAEALSVTRTI